MNMAVSHGAGVLPSSAMDRFTKETPSWGEEHSGLAKNKLVIKTTKNGLKASLELWSTLIKDPQFQKANLAHSKTQTVTTIAHYKENLELIAYIHLIDTILPELLISADFDKISQSIEALTAQDLEKENTQQFLSTKPKIVVVGNVTKKELIDLLDRTFGALPLHSLPSSPPSLHPQWAAKEVIIEKDIPESVVTFGQPGIHPQSKDYAQYILLQNVLHGRFFEELREKRGLIYSIHFEGHHYNTIDLLTGYFSCECAQAPHVVKFIRSEWERLKDFGITQKELSNAKLSFKRSKVLSLTSTEAVAQEYANPQAFNLGPHAAMTLLENTEKVTLEEINLFVQKLLDPKSLTFVLIGKK
jgi:zinc protease